MIIDRIETINKNNNKADLDKVILIKKESNIVN